MPSSEPHPPVAPWYFDRLFVCHLSVPLCGAGKHHGHRSPSPALVRRRTNNVQTAGLCPSQPPGKGLSTIVASWAAGFLIERFGEPQPLVGAEATVTFVIRQILQWAENLAIGLTFSSHDFFEVRISAARSSRTLSPRWPSRAANLRLIGLRLGAKTELRANRIHGTCRRARGRFPLTPA